MKRLAALITRNRAVLGASLAASLLLAMTTLLVFHTPGRPRSHPPATGHLPASQKTTQDWPVLTALPALEDATQLTPAFSAPADGRSWDEPTAARLGDRLAELSTGPLRHMLAFVQTLPPGDFKDTAWLQTLQTIAASSEETALLSAALEKTPSHLREQAWSAVAEGHASHDPAAAMLWTDSISDPLARQSCAQLVASRWGALEPAAALAWLDQRPLDEHWEPFLQCIVTSWASARPAEAMEWAIRQSQYDAGTDHPSLVQLVALALQPEE